MQATAQITRYVVMHLHLLAIEAGKPASLDSDK
jgi:hypothetical protein